MKLPDMLGEKMPVKHGVYKIHAEYINIGVERNEILDQLSAIEINTVDFVGFDRENLARLLLMMYNGFNFDDTEHVYRELALSQADAICAAKPSIIVERKI